MDWKVNWINVVLPNELLFDSKLRDTLIRAVIKNEIDYIEGNGEIEIGKYTPYDFFLYRITFRENDAELIFRDDTGIDWKTIDFKNTTK